MINATYNILIRVSKALFLLATVGVVVTAIATIFSDVVPTTRMFWIALGVTCLGVVSSWKLKEKQ